MDAALFPDVVVNGEVIPSTLVAAEAQNHEGPRGKPGIPWRKAARALALRTLLLQEARRLGLTETPRQVAPSRFETEEEALIRGLLAQAVDPEKPDEAAIRAEWARDPERFRSPPLWEVSHILVACGPGDAAERQAARDRATDLAGRALGNPRGFARLASEASDCPSKTQGGSLGQLGPGDVVPEFETVLHQLQDGEITPEPIETRHGWHVVRMDACAPGAVLPYEGARPRVSAAMEKAAWARAARSYTQKLVASARISGADLRPLQPEGADHERVRH